MRNRMVMVGCSASLGLLLVASTAAPALAQGQEETVVGSVHGRAQEGKQHYRRYCVGCHGDAGDGQGENAPWLTPKPRDFTAAVFECRSTPTGTLPTDDDLYRSVTRGFVTTNMPPWLPLTVQTRVDAIAYIKTFSPRWATQKAGTPIVIPTETPADMPSILRGREVYQKMQCWQCHGPAGHGDGPAASTLVDSKDNPIRPYNFATGTRFKCGSSNQDLYTVFMTGLDGTPMPSFADNLTPDEAWDLVHFLRTLQPVKSPELAEWNAWLPTHGNELKPLGPETGQ